MESNCDNCPQDSPQQNFEGKRQNANKIDLTLLRTFLKATSEKLSSS